MKLVWKIGKIAFGLATCTALPLAHAVENGAPTTGFGIMTFGAGFTPPPTDVATFAVRLVAYKASNLQDGEGNDSRVKSDVTVNSFVVGALKMTKQELLGGTYGFGAVLPILSMSNDLTIPLAPPAPPGLTISRTGGKDGIGDLELIPAVIQWKPAPGFGVNAAMRFQLPTGSYDKARTINPSTKHRTYMPTVGLTYITPDKWEASSNIQLNIHDKNKESGYQSGTEYQHEFAFGKHFGDFRVGLGGYIIQQIEDDKSNGASLANSRTNARALGPAIQYFNPKAAIPVWWAHIYQEFGAVKRNQGVQVDFRAAWAL